MAGTWLGLRNESFFLAKNFRFLSRKSVFIGPRCTWSDLWVPISVSKRGCWNLTDLTLADQATNSIQADNTNMAIQGNVAMEMTQPGGQLWN